MKVQNRKLLYLCSIFVIFNILDAVITLFVVQNGLGAETNRILRYITRTIPFSYMMLIKIILATGSMYIIYMMDGKYDTPKVGVHDIKGIDVIYGGLILVDTAYLFIVINGLIVLFFPAYAPFKTQ